MPSALQSVPCPISNLCPLSYPTCVLPPLIFVPYCIFTLWPVTNCTLSKRSNVIPIVHYAIYICYQLYIILVIICYQPNNMLLICYQLYSILVMILPAEHCSSNVTNCTNYSTILVIMFSTVHYSSDMLPTVQNSTDHLLPTVHYSSDLLPTVHYSSDNVINCTLF